MRFYAFVTRGPDRLYRATFPDLPGLHVPPAPVDHLQAATCVALDAHLRTRSSPLPPPSPLEAVRSLYPGDDGYWLSFHVNDPTPEAPAVDLKT